MLLNSYFLFQMLYKSVKVITEVITLNKSKYILFLNFHQNVNEVFI